MLLEKIIAWFIIGLAALLALCEPVSASQFGITPTNVVIEEGDSSITLTETSGYVGDVRITLKDIPSTVLQYSPTYVTLDENNRTITLDIKVVASGVHEGFLRLKPMTGAAVGVGIQIPLTVKGAAPYGPLDFEGHVTELYYIIIGFMVLVLAVLTFIKLAPRGR